MAGHAGLESAVTPGVKRQERRPSRADESLSTSRTGKPPDAHKSASMVGTRARRRAQVRKRPAARAEELLQAVGARSSTQRARQAPSRWQARDDKRRQGGRGHVRPPPLRSNVHFKCPARGPGEASSAAAPAEPARDFSRADWRHQWHTRHAQANPGTTEQPPQQNQGRAPGGPGTSAQRLQRARSRSAADEERHAPQSGQ